MKLSIQNLSVLDRFFFLKRMDYLKSQLESKCRLPIPQLYRSHRTNFKFHNFFKIFHLTENLKYSLCRHFYIKTTFNDVELFSLIQKFPSSPSILKFPGASNNLLEKFSMVAWNQQTFVKILRGAKQVWHKQAQTLRNCTPEKRPSLCKTCLTKWIKYLFFYEERGISLQQNISSWLRIYLEQIFMLFIKAKLTRIKGLPGTDLYAVY